MKGTSTYKMVTDKIGSRAPVEGQRLSRMPLAEKIASGKPAVAAPPPPAKAVVVPTRVMSKGVASTQTDEEVVPAPSTVAPPATVATSTVVPPIASTSAAAQPKQKVKMVMKKTKRRDPNQSSAAVEDQEGLKFDPHMSSVFQASFQPVTLNVERAKIPPPENTLNVGKAKFG